MVKKLFILALIINFSFCNSLQNEIKELIPKSTYNKHQKQISRIFKSENNFKDKCKSTDLNLVFKTLEENSILKSRLNKPQNFKIKFTSQNNSKIFIKILIDTLKECNINYYQINDFSKLKDKNILSIGFLSNFYLDHGLMYKIFKSYGVKITNIKKNKENDFSYSLDFSNAKLKNSQNFFDIKNLSSIDIDFNLEICEHPVVEIFDKNLNLIKKYEIDKNNFSFQIDKDSFYMKITDFYGYENPKCISSIRRQ